MTELYIFSQDDKPLTILTEETGLTSAPFRDELNKVSSEPFIFTVDADIERAKYVEEENRVVFRDREGDFREFVIKELDDINGIDGPETKATCIPSFIDELSNHIVVDKRFVDKEAQNALDAALEGTRWSGIVEVSLGLASTNFYYITSVDAVWDIRNIWGGDIKDVVYLSEDETHIAKREIHMKQRFGADNGLRFEIDHNIDEIQRTVLSYPLTALYGRGSSLMVEDDDGEHTGGYTRYIDFADVEWKKSKGDPVDKPKGQKWVGDPDALLKYGYKKDGQLIHLEGIYSNQDFEDQEELLWATWQHLQKVQHPEVNYRLKVDLLNKKASLGDTAVAIDREFARPIEIQTRIIAIEYNLLDIENTTVMEMGEFLDLDDDIREEMDEIRNEINKPRPERPINNDSFPDINPGTPTNVEAHGSFRWIQLFWDYDSDIYISHYEVYGSQVADFVPDEQHLLYRGRVSSFNHEVDTDEKWYYYVRAVNTRGTAGDFSNQVEASSVRIINDDILFGSITADKLEDNLDLANKLSEGTLDWINDEPLYKIRESENSILNDVGNRIGDVLNDIDLINDDLSDLHYQDFEINERIDGLSSIVQDTEFTMNDLTDELEHQSTQISNWEQRADGFEQSVVDIEGDLENAWTEMSLIEQTAKDLTFSVSELETDFNNLEIGEINLISNSDQEITSNAYLVKEYFINEDFITGETYTAVIKGSINSGQEFGLWQNTGSNSRGRFKEVGNGLFKLTFESVSITSGNERKIRIYNYPSSGASSATIEWIKVVRANKTSLSWSPAPEDMADKAHLLSYINLSKEGIRIHGDRVSITGQTFIEEGVIGTAAIAELAVDRFHLKYGIIDTVHIEDAAITDAKIHSLNADKLTAGAIRGIDVYGAKFRSSSGTDYMEIVGGNVQLTQSNGRYVDISPSGIYGYNQGGSLRFQADSSLVTSAAFGTSNSNVYLASSSGGEARVVRYSSIPGDGSASDYSYRGVRALSYKSPPGRNLYFGTDGELRVMSEGLSSVGVYRNVRMGRLYANTHEVRDGAILYLRTDDRVRIMGTGDSGGYKDLQTAHIQAQSIRRNTATGGRHFYIGTDLGELRVTGNSLADSGYRDVRARNYYADSGYFESSTTARLVANGGGRVFLHSTVEARITLPGSNTDYINIRAADFLASSSQKWKSDIEKYTGSALDLFRKSVIYQYYKHGSDALEYGFITERETPSEVKRAEGISSYSLQGLSVKAIQEIDLKFTNKIIKIEDYFDEKDLQIQYLQQKIKQQDKEIQELREMIA